MAAIHSAIPVHGTTSRSEDLERNSERALIEEDLFAAWSVCGVLITIVSMGALLGIASVLVIVLL